MVAREDDAAKPGDAHADAGWYRIRGTPEEHARFTGRFANIWGVTDVGTFCAALVALDPEADDPVKMVTNLAVVDDGALRATQSHSMAPPGEMIRRAVHARRSRCAGGCALGDMNDNPNEHCD